MEQKIDIKALCESHSYMRLSRAVLKRRISQDPLTDPIFGSVDCSSQLFYLTSEDLAVLHDFVNAEISTARSILDSPSPSLSSLITAERMFSGIIMVLRAIQKRESLLRAQTGIPPLITSTSADFAACSLRVFLSSSERSSRLYPSFSLDAFKDYAVSPAVRETLGPSFPPEDLTVFAKALRQELIEKSLLSTSASISPVLVLLIATISESPDDCESVTSDLEKELPLAPGTSSLAKCLLLLSSSHQEDHDKALSVALTSIPPAALSSCGLISSLISAASDPKDWRVYSILSRLGDSSIDPDAHFTASLYHQPLIEAFNCNFYYG